MRRGRLVGRAASLLLGFGLATATAKCGDAPQFRSTSSPPNSTPVSGVPVWSCSSAPTNVQTTMLRPGAGAFRAPREGGLHTGVDIMLRDYARSCVGSTRNRSVKDLEVYAVADGVVAYSQTNTAQKCPRTRPGCDLFTTGLGHTVIIDHRNGVYSLYAHMAQIRDPLLCLPRSYIESGSASKVQVGDRVSAGQVIGYLGSLGPGVSSYEGPSGNAVVIEQRVQLHFEFFLAPSGQSSKGQISAIVPRSQRGLVNPRGFLEAFYE